MRKFILMVLTGFAIMFAAPEFAAAAPISPSGIAAAADNVSSTEQVWHRRWHRRHYHGYRVYRVYPRYRYRHRYWRRW